GENDIFQWFSRLTVKYRFAFASLPGRYPPFTAYTVIRSTKRAMPRLIFDPVCGDDVIGEILLHPFCTQGRASGRHWGSALSGYHQPHEPRLNEENDFVNWSNGKSHEGGARRGCGLAARSSRRNDTSRSIARRRDVRGVLADSEQRV